MYVSARTIKIWNQSSHPWKGSWCPGWALRYVRAPSSHGIAHEYPHRRWPDISVHQTQHIFAHLRDSGPAPLPLVVRLTRPVRLPLPTEARISSQSFLKNSINAIDRIDILYRIISEHLSPQAACNSSGCLSNHPGWESMQVLTRAIGDLAPVASLYPHPSLNPFLSCEWNV